MPSFGARRSLDDAASAASAGKLDDAAAHLRAYFAARYRGGLAMIQGVDADAAMLAGTCAILRGDLEELGGVAQLVELGEHPTTVAARRWVDLLKAAGDGDVAKVFNEREAMTSPTLAPLLPAVLLIASERGASSLTPEWASRLRQAFERSTLSSEVRARVAIVLASVALQANRRDDATRELAAIDGSAPVLPRFFADLAAERFDEAAALVGAIPSEERAAAVAFAARLSVGASSSFVERALSIVGPLSTAAQRAAMVAAMATALAREGQAARALSVLDVEKQRSPGSPALLLATAYAALAAEDPGLATSTLNRVSLDDAGAIALRLVALAAKGDADTLARELPNADALSEEAKEAVKPAVLAALMRGGAPLAEATTPPWLMRAPTDADGLYAWAVMRLRQGATKDAGEAFDRSIAAKPELAQKSEAPEAARLAMARQALASFDFQSAAAWLSKVTSPSFAAVKRRLEAMLALAEFASRTGARVEAHAFPILVEQMKQVAATDHDRAAHLELTEEAGRMRARESLERGDVAGARAWLGANTGGDAEGSFLAAVTAVFEGQPLDRIERELLAATERAPDDAKLFVLLSEVRAATQGAEAKVATLEAARGRAAGSVLLQEALVAAYGGARRGLDAKKIGFAELRRLGGNVPALVADQIREALALEAPPKTRVAKISLTRAARASLLSKETIGQRVDVLVARARAVAARDPRANETIAPLLDSLKRAVVGEDLDAASHAELELVELCGRLA